MEQVRAYREWKRITPCKESIAMVNLSYIATVQEVLLEKHHQAYQQKKTTEQAKRTKRCAHDRHRYANMNSVENRGRAEQVTANHELKRITPCKESIMMVRHAYIATEQEVRTQTLLHHRNKEFLAKQNKRISKMLLFDINWKI
jgi:hypothetical protein